jgi:hypothetical protein
MIGKRTRVHFYLSVHRDTRVSQAYFPRVESVNFFLVKIFARRARTIFAFFIVQASTPLSKVIRSFYGAGISSQNLAMVREHGFDHNKTNRGLAASSRTNPQLFVYGIIVGSGVYRTIFSYAAHIASCPRKSKKGISCFQKPRQRNRRN